MFEYALVVRMVGTDPVRWRWKGPGQVADGGLLGVLNQAGKEGWEVVAAGDFGGSPTAEVLLKRPLRE